MKSSLCMIILTALLPVLVTSHAYSQDSGTEIAPPEMDFTFEGFVPSDSLRYDAVDIQYGFDERTVTMTGNATVDYLGRTLKSHQIIYWQDYDYLEAIGRQDSTGAWTDTPVFTDTNGEELRGRRIEYDLVAQQGLVLEGRTQYDNGFMAADRIKRSAEDTLFVSEGTYTTCDKENPDYYFAGDRMKFILNDKLIIKPIVGYVQDIPVVWFPFYVFPIKKGRQSGFLMPRYGSSRRDGRYLSNLGYYWAPSDYFDYEGAATVRERNGWLARNWMNYDVRYRMSGSVFASFESQERSGSGSREWKLRVSHSQTLSPTMSISGSGQFESSKYSQFNSSNLYERLNRSLYSSFSLRKSWKESGNSLIASASYTRNLDTRDTTTKLPDISFRMPRKLLFGGEKTAAATKYVRVDPDTETDQSWYNSIYYTFNAGLSNTDNNRSDIDSFTRNMDMSTSLSSSNKIMGWIAAEPSLTLRENFTVSNEPRATARYVRRDAITFGMRMGTTLYGLFRPNIGGITAVRHVLTPDVSYSYGLSRGFSGEDSDALFRFDRDTLDDKPSSSMRVNLRNVFQAKQVKGEEETSFDLFTLNFSSGVDFKNHERPIAPLSTTLEIKPGRTFTTRLTASHSFYTDDDEFKPFSPYLDNLQISTSFGVGGQAGSFGVSRRGDANTMLDRDVFDEEVIPGGVEEEAMPDGSSIPIRMSLSHSYGIRRTSLPGKDKYRTEHFIKPNITISPTRKFNVTYNFQYDIENKDMAYNRITINRDLHCWEANLSWIPSGLQEGYYFKVNIKELPDVKVEKRRGTSSYSY